MRTEPGYAAQRARTIAADKAHTERMTAIAHRGGKTIEQMRALPEGERVMFMSKHRAPPTSVD